MHMKKCRQMLAGAMAALTLAPWYRAVAAK